MYVENLGVGELGEDKQWGILKVLKNNRVRPLLI